MRGKIYNINPEPVPKAEGFVKRLVSLNAINDAEFEKWLFYPGMLFRAGTKWWGDRGNRNGPHEGLDLCLFKTRDGKIHYLSKNTIIPVIFEGEVRKTSSDFLGESAFVYHDIYNKLGGQLMTAYGHLKLDDRVCNGKLFGEKDSLGSIADTRNRSVKIPPHVHISVAWISKSIHYENLNWECINDPGKTTLLDPLEVLGCRHSILT